MMLRLRALYDCLVQCCGAAGGQNQEEEGERTRLLSDQNDRSDPANFTVRNVGNILCCWKPYIEVDPLVLSSV